MLFKQLRYAAVRVRAFRWAVLALLVARVAEGRFVPEVWTRLFFNASMMLTTGATLGCAAGLIF